MLNENMLGFVENMKKHAEVVETIQNILYTCLKNEQLSLEDRWHCFVNAPECFWKNEPWIVHLNYDGEEISWFDDHYCERHSRVDLKDFVEGKGQDWDSKKKQYVDNPNKAAMDKLKEDVLALGCHTFRLDW